jgi:hypothetical protein
MQHYRPIAKPPSKSTTGVTESLTLLELSDHAQDAAYRLLWGNPLLSINTTRIRVFAELAGSIELNQIDAPIALQVITRAAAIAHDQIDLVIAGIFISHE